MSGDKTNDADAREGNILFILSMAFGEDEFSESLQAMSHITRPYKTDVSRGVSALVIKDLV